MTCFILQNQPVFIINLILLCLNTSWRCSRYFVGELYTLQTPYSAWFFVVIGIFSIDTVSKLVSVTLTPNHWHRQTTLVVSFIKACCCMQGGNEVRCPSGQETSLAPPCSNLRSFGSKSAVEESTGDIVRTFWRRHNDSAPVELCPPCPPRYASGCLLETMEWRCCKANARFFVVTVCCSSCHFFMIFGPTLCFVR